MATFKVETITKSGEVIRTERQEIDDTVIANAARLEKVTILSSSDDGTPMSLKAWDCLNQWTQYYFRETPMA